MVNPVVPPLTATEVTVPPPPPPPEEEILRVLVEVPSSVIPEPATKFRVGSGVMVVFPETVPPSAEVLTVGLPAPPVPE